MERYIELLEFIKASKLMGSGLLKIIQDIDDNFPQDNSDNISIYGTGNLVEISYRDPKAQMVIVASIIIDNTNKDE